ncbi:MAG: tryptophan synthase subunit alpha [Mycobacteriales bacterium]
MSASLAAAFAAARGEGRAVLIGYLPAGFPTVARSIDALGRMVEHGVDVVEVGLPYSDPVMDGPVIQAAVDQALAAGTRTTDVLEVVAAVAATGVPTLVMSYWNPIERFGAARFAAALAGAGACGAITPDLTPEEAGEWLEATSAHRLDPVFLLAPSSSAERIRLVGKVSGGFVYAASTMGITGTSADVSVSAPQLVARVRELVSLPVAVGLGVSSGEAAAAVASYADGVIVGAAFVRALREDVDGLAGIDRLSEELARGVRGQW